MYFVGLDEFSLAVLQPEVFLGVAEAGFFPGIMYYLTKWATNAQRAKFIAIFMASIGLSGCLAGPLAGMILSNMDGVLELRGWQWLFILEGIPAILLGITAYFYLDETPADAKWLSADEQNAIQHQIELESKALESHDSQSILSLFKQKQFYALFIIGTGILGGGAAIMFWIPTIFKRAGIENFVEIGLYSAIPFSFAVVTQFLIARSSDARQERVWHTVTPLIFAIAGWIAMATLPLNFAGSLMAMTVITMGSLGAMGPFWAMPCSFIHSELRAAGIAIISTIGGIASFIQPIAAGYLNYATGDLTGGFVYNASAISLAVILFMALIKSGAIKNVVTEPKLSSFNRLP